MKQLLAFVFITTVSIHLSALLSGCTDSQDKPISQQQHAMLLRVVSNHHELQGLYAAAKADGVITKKEYLNILYQVSEVSDGTGK
jgi:uncharacterized membrane protein YebE (DUF533 family)